MKERKIYRQIVGKNITPQDVKISTAMLQKDRYEAEAKRLKMLKLGPSRETQYHHHLRTYVPRPRLIGSDGIVRARRLTNEEPTKRPADSEYGRLNAAFASIKKEGIRAKWNVLASTYLSYYCDLPTDKPGLFHWKADGSLNETFATGVEWTREWECVQDSIDLNGVGPDAETSENVVKISEKIFNSYGFKTIIDPYNNGHADSMSLIFRGSGGVCLQSWDWVSNCISDNPIDPPPIP